MWICLNDAFLSIVVDRTHPGYLLVRARRQGEIEKVFPDAIVLRNVGSDYRYRALIPRSQVALLLMERLEAIDYGNFKNSVLDVDLHDAYYQIWRTMVRYHERETCTP